MSASPRIRRHVTPARAGVPRRIAGVVAVAVSLAIGGRIVLTRAPAALHESAGRTSRGSTVDSGRAAPATVLRHPDPARPLAERWEWARAEARRHGGRGIRIGYHVRSSLLRRVTVTLGGLRKEG